MNAAQAPLLLALGLVLALPCSAQDAPTPTPTPRRQPRSLAEAAAGIRLQRTPGAGIVVEVVSTPVPDLRIDEVVTVATRDGVPVHIRLHVTASRYFSPEDLAAWMRGEAKSLFVDVQALERAEVEFDVPAPTFGMGTARTEVCHWTRTAATWCEWEAAAAEELAGDDYGDR